VCVSYRNRLMTVPVVSGCGSKRIVGLFRWEHQQISANAIVVRLHHWFAVAWARSPTSFASDC